MHWTEALTERDARKIIYAVAFFGALFVSGLLMPSEVTLFLFYIAAFALPPLYQKQNEQFDSIIGTVDGIIDKIAFKIETKLFKVKE